MIFYRDIKHINTPEPVMLTTTLKSTKCLTHGFHVGKKTTRSCLAEKLDLSKNKIVTIQNNSLESPATSTEEFYLRLHCLSKQSVKPNDVNFDEILSLLHNVT